MKSLDDVIKSFDVCMNARGCRNCPYAVYDEDGFEEYLECSKQEEDAFSYLIEYRKLLNEYRKPKDWMAEEPDINDPLSWDDLQSMEGKPVWLESMVKKSWAIFDGTYVRHEVVCGVFAIGQWNSGMFPRGEIGKTWNVYRKERSE